MTKFPSKEQAHDLLSKGEDSFPGPWVQHSLCAAKCAYEVASLCDGLIADKAYVLGLLHDIGRTKGVTSCKHIIDGYNMMTALGYTDVARICLTHSFPYQSIKAFSGDMDITDEEYTFIDDFLINIEYDEYDLLIQLCDALAGVKGPVIIEQRLIDVAIRRGITEFSVEKWKKFIELKKYFDNKIGQNIYELLHVRL